MISTEKTKIFGKIAYDVRVEPVDKREEEKLLERRLFEADHKNTGVQIIGRGSTVKAMQSGTTHASKWGDTFIVSILRLCVNFAVLIWPVENFCSSRQTQEGRASQGRSYPRERADRPLLEVLCRVPVLVNESTSPTAAAA
jgi:hypothetical protein